MRLICIWQTVFTLHLFEESDFPQDCWQALSVAPRLQGRGSTQLQTCVSPAHVTASWLTTHATRFLVLSLYSPAIYTRAPATVCVFFSSASPLMVPHTISFKAHLITANLEHMSECVESWIEQLGIHLRDSKQLYIASHFSNCQMNVIIFYFCHYQLVSVHLLFSNQFVHI